MSATSDERRDTRPARAGDRVEHTNTRRVATVLKRVPHSTYVDLQVQPDEGFFDDWPNSPTWWDESNVRIVERVATSGSYARTAETGVET